MCHDSADVGEGVGILQLDTKCHGTLHTPRKKKSKPGYVGGGGEKEHLSHFFVLLSNREMAFFFLETG